MSASLSTLGRDGVFRAVSADEKGVALPICGGTTRTVKAFACERVEHNARAFLPDPVYDEFWDERDYLVPDASLPLVPGEARRARVFFQPIDLVIRAGDRS